MKAPTEKEELKTAVSAAGQNNEHLLDTAKETGNLQPEKPEDSPAALLPEENLPEPPPGSPEQVREPAAESGVSVTPADLLNFYLTGVVPAGITVSQPLPPEGGSPRAGIPAGKLTPAALFAYRDLSRVRYDYPLCLPDSPGKEWAIPLRKIFDQLLSEAVPAAQTEASEASEEGASVRKTLLALETQIKILLEETGGGRLSELWEAASRMLLEESGAKDQKEDPAGRQLAAARQSLKIDGVLLPCDSRAPLELLRAAAALEWRRKIEPLRREAADLIARLSAMLHGGDGNPSGASAQEFKASLGNSAEEEVDYRALSQILSQSRPPVSLPEKRHRRIAENLKTLESIYPMLRAESDVAPASKSKRPALLPPGSLCDSAKSALEAGQNWQKALISFFKALRIARLEVKNRYREEKHDAFFDTFDINFLTAEESAFFPPILVALDATGIKAQDKSLLIDILSSDLPVKILLRVDDLPDSDEAEGRLPAASNWTAQIARMALNLNHAFVLQTALSNLPALAAGLMRGLRCQGPAFYSVYSGDGAGSHSHLPAYLCSAAASRSRAFPGFLYDPSAGEDWASRFSVNLSPQPEQIWPRSDFSHRSNDGQEKTVALEFTYADFLAADRRFAGQFLPLPPSAWNENMVPLAEYFRLAKEELADSAPHGGASAESKRLPKVPFLWMADESGVLWRVIMTWKVVSAAQKIARDWRILQELAGINNPYILRLIAAEKKRIEEEMRGEVEKIRAQQQSATSRGADEMTRDIASRIISGLMAVGRGEPLPAAPPAGAPVPSPKAETAPATAAAEAAPPAKAEELIIEEAYIDSPLCTSCNDCININNRMFAYNENKQAYIKDVGAGTFKQLVQAAEKCPVRIIHPGKPKNPNEPGLEALVKRAAKFNIL